MTFVKLRSDVALDKQFCVKKLVGNEFDDEVIDAEVATALKRSKSPGLPAQATLFIFQLIICTRDKWFYQGGQWNGYLNSKTILTGDDVAVLGVFIEHQNEYPLIIANNYLPGLNHQLLFC